MRRTAFALLVILFALPAHAGSPLKFPKEPTAGVLYKPDGPGPFPALVLLHSCAGVQPHISDWTARLREGGYVALVVDSFTPRGAGIVCGNWRVTTDDVAADAFAALDHLRTLPFVNGNRIAAMGFSYGAMAALKTTSAAYRRSNRPDGRGFGAVVAFYPACTPKPGMRGDVEARWNNLRDDADTPVLILIGDADDETPASLCTAKADELQKVGRPVSVKVYHGATHAFDSSDLGNRVFRNPRGYVYRYDPQATADAAKVSAEFLEKHIPK